MISASLSVNLGTCGFPLIQLAGVITGAFGKYTGFTSNGSASFNPCILPNPVIVSFIPRLRDVGLEWGARDGHGLEVGLGVGLVGVGVKVETLLLPQEVIMNTIDTNA